MVILIILWAIFIACWSASKERHAPSKDHTLIQLEEESQSTKSPQNWNVILLDDEQMIGWF